MCSNHVLLELELRYCYPLHVGLKLINQVDLELVDWEGLSKQHLYTMLVVVVFLHESMSK